MHQLFCGTIKKCGYNVTNMAMTALPILTTDEPVISSRGLTKRFASRVAVNGVDFDIYPGRCFGFVGPNGAGKTTTLRMAMGLTPLSGGTLSVFGLPVSENASAIRARVGIVPQADNLDPDFTVEENLYVNWPRHRAAGWRTWATVFTAIRANRLS